MPVGLAYSSHKGLVAQMACNGSTMSGLTTRERINGLSWTVLDLFLLLAKDMPRLLSTTSCIYSVVVRMRALTWVI
jgi:hypothetical protein